MSIPSIKYVSKLLVECYGLPKTKPQRPLLDVLMETILSQNTSDTNSQRAYANLRQAFPTWRDVARAGARRVATSIRQGGLANIKSKRMVRIAKKLQHQLGNPSLEHLRKIDPEAAYQSLKSLAGVGPKTAACTLLFGAGIPIFPVDTHIFRVCSRLGWVLPRENRERFQERFRKKVPQDLVYPFHMNLITHGRNICRPQNPRCTECCLWNCCPSKRVEQ